MGVVTLTHVVVQASNAHKDLWRVSKRPTWLRGLGCGTAPRWCPTVAHCPTSIHAISRAIEDQRLSPGCVVWVVEQRHADAPVHPQVDGGRVVWPHGPQVAAHKGVVGGVLGQQPRVVGGGVPRLGAG